MSIDFLIGAIRASRDLHPQVKTELEEILHRVQEMAGREQKERTVRLRLLGNKSE